VRGATRAEATPPPAALTQHDPAARSVRGVANADVEELQRLLAEQVRCFAVVSAHCQDV
jgi:hypothetical protein